MMKETLAGALVAFGVMVAACAGGGSEDSADGNTGECSSDSDCKGDRVCSDGECVEAPSPNGGSSSSGPPPPSCADIGESCASEECCNDGGICVNYGGSLGTLCGPVRPRKPV